MAEQRDKPDQLTAWSLVDSASSGAFAAGLTLLAAVMMPAIILVFKSPEDLDLPLLFLALFVWAGPIAMGGAICGTLGMLTRNAFFGACIGALVFVSAGIAYIAIFMSSREPRDNPMSVLTYSIVSGYIAGAVGNVAGRLRDRRGQPGAKRVTWGSTLLLGPVLTLLVIWETHQWQYSLAQSEITASGGSVTWDAVSDPRGHWEVALGGPGIGDTELEYLAPALRVTHDSIWT